MWCVETTAVNGPFPKSSRLRGFGVPEDDYDRLAEISGVYKDGGRELEQVELATELELFSIASADAIPGMFKADSGALVITETVRETIERLDPGAHQISPLQATNRGEPIAGAECFQLNVWRRLPTVIDEGSAVVERKGFDGKVRRRLELVERRVRASAAAGDGLHLWRDSSYPQALFMADALAEPLRDAGLLRVVPMFRVETA